CNGYTYQPQHRVGRRLSGDDGHCGTLCDMSLIFALLWMIHPVPPTAFRAETPSIFCDEAGCVLLPIRPFDEHGEMVACEPEFFLTPSITALHRVQYICGVGGVRYWVHQRSR